MESNGLIGTNWSLVFNLVTLLLLVISGVFALSLPLRDKKWWAFAGALAGFILAGMLVQSEILKTLLIDAAALMAAGLIWTKNTPAAKKAALNYLIFMLASAACLISGLLISENLSTSSASSLYTLTAALMLTGFALKLALIPLYFWLPAVTEAAAPLTSALIISIIDMAAFRELISLRTSSPWVFEDHTQIWLVLGLLSMFGGALLAIAQRDIKRMLAFSTIDDMGYLVLGVLFGSQMSLTGAFLGAISHAFFKVLLFASVALVEEKSAEPLTLESKGMAGKYPFCGAAFIAGSLGMIGVPPLMGFLGRWRLYLSAIQYGGILLGLGMAAATILALFYYVRAIHRTWLGNAEDCQTVKIPRLASFLMVLMIALAILAGLVPGLLLT